MSIEALTDIVAPPENPLNTGPPERWDAVCNELGTQLPSDCRDLALTYGSGYFAGHITVFNPFDDAYRRAVDSNLETHRVWTEGEEHEIPYGFFPEPRSLLPWGEDDQSNSLWWLTEGEPDDWPVVLRPSGNAEGEFYRLDMSMTWFLALLFSKAMSGNPIWKRDHLMYPETRQFTPEPLSVWYPEPLDYKSVYELYRENGDKARFFVRKESYDTVGCPGLFYIQSIGGQTEGDLQGDPPEYNDAVVVADEYVNGELVEQGCVIERAFVERWRRHSPPEGWEPSHD